MVFNAKSKKSRFVVIGNLKLTQKEFSNATKRFEENEERIKKKFKRLRKE